MFVYIYIYICRWKSVISPIKFYEIRNVKSLSGSFCWLSSFHQEEIRMLNLLAVRFYTGCVNFITSALQLRENASRKVGRFLVLSRSLTHCLTLSLSLPPNTSSIKYWISLENYNIQTLYRDISRTRDNVSFKHKIFNAFISNLY